MIITTNTYIYLGYGKLNAISMKIHRMTFLLICSIFMTLMSCSPKPYVLDTDYDRHGHFKEYKSFTFLNMVNSGNGAYEEEIVRNTIFKRLIAMGYKYTEENPDLLVSCKFFYQPARVIKFDQCHINQWLKEDQVENSMIKNSYKRNVNLPADACQVFLIEAKSNRMIWKGYAGQSEPWTHEQQLVASIGRMMDEYPVVVY